MTLQSGRDGARTYVPLQVFQSAMAIEGEESGKLGQIMDHVMFGLQKEGLIDLEFLYGAVKSLSNGLFKAPGAGFIFQPSSLGTELFLWGHGRSELNVHDFLDPAISFELIEGVTIPEGAMRTRG